MQDKCVICGEIIPEGRQVCPGCGDHPARTVAAMRERLVKLIKQIVIPYWAEQIADHLLANGVIIPPCKVGDTVWFNTWKKNATVCVGIQPHKIDRIDVSFVCDTENLVETRVPMWEIGKRVFLTREAAERTLKGGEGK